jgi:hypothetical protein
MEVRGSYYWSSLLLFTSTHSKKLQVIPTGTPIFYKQEKNCKKKDIGINLRFIAYHLLLTDKPTTQTIK